MSAEATVAVIGEWVKDSPIAENEGAVHTYTRSPGADWVWRSTISPHDGETASRFGTAVAMSGDGGTIAVYATGPTDDGGVYVYGGSGGSWTLQARLAQPLPVSQSAFGMGIALSDNGNTLVVGAPRTATTGPQAGAAFVYQRVGGTWSMETMLLASDAAEFDHFGWRVAIAGDASSLVVTVPGDDTAAGDRGGSVCYFERQGGGWTEAARLFANAGAPPSSDFGRTLSLSRDGSTLAVGSAFPTNITIFEKTGPSWSARPAIATNAGLPLPLALTSSGDVLLVGMDDTTVGGVRGAGAVEV